MGVGKRHPVGSRAGKRDRSLGSRVGKRDRPVGNRAGKRDRPLGSRIGKGGSGMSGIAKLKQQLAANAAAAEQATDLLGRAAQDRERFAMCAAEKEGRRAMAEARADEAAETAMMAAAEAWTWKAGKVTWKAAALRRSVKLEKWAAWEKHQAQVSLWERDKHAEHFRKLLDSDGEE